VRHLLLGQNVIGSERRCPLRGRLRLRLALQRRRRRRGGQHRLLQALGCRSELCGACALALAALHKHKPSMVRSTKSDELPWQASQPYCVARCLCKD
jgi:hypothetical protein